MNSWEKAREHSKKRSGPGMFFKLENDGDSMVVAFVGDIHTWDAVNPHGKGYEPYNPENPDHADKPIRYRAAINVYCPADRVTRIWEFGAKVFDSIDVVRVKYGLKDKLYEIKRHGAKGDKETTYSILPEPGIDEEIKEQIALAKLHDLSNKGEKAIHGEPAADDDIPF